MLLEHKDVPVADHNDEFVELALRFLQKDRLGTESPTHKRLIPAEEIAAIRSAQQIHQHEDIRKWALRAWLLTGESPEVISEQTSLPIEEIVWYVRLFFDVQDRLGSPSFIIHRAVGRKIHYGLSVKDVGVILSHYAYFGGRYVLESLLADFIEAGKEDYSYLFDGTYRDADLPLERRLLHQAIRVRLLSPEDILKMLNRALQDPEIAAQVNSLDELIDLLATGGTCCPSTPTAQDQTAATQDEHAAEPCETGAEEAAQEHSPTGSPGDFAAIR